MGLGVTCQELLAFYDSQSQQCIYAYAQSLLPLDSMHFDDEAQWQEMHGKLKSAEPKIAQQKWMYKHDDKWYKGLEFAQTLVHIKQWPCTLEPDFRSMNSPLRQDVIIQACEDLIARLTSECKKCGQVDFVFDKPIDGLPCELCALPTKQTKALQADCASCTYSQTKTLDKTHANPANCDWCNP
jgi:hypothetical protein